MAKQQSDYLSYLLRLWRVDGGERAIWRASLHNPHTREQRGFASLDDLFWFLRKQTSGKPDVEADKCRTGE
jgi:hypothetical protein